MSALETTPCFALWGCEPFSLAPDVVLLESPTRAALFATRTQQLHQLNDTAALLWRKISAGHGAASISQALIDAGCHAQDISTFTDAAIRIWMSNGYVVPTRVYHALEASPLHFRELAIAGATVRLNIYPTPRPARADLALAAECARALDEAFGHFACDRPPTEPSTSSTVSLAALEGLVFVLLGRHPLCALPPEALVPGLKAILTRRVTDASQSDFYVHAAQVSKGKQTLLLCGASGAGKSTLALALASRGYRYGGDDIVRVNGDGLCAGLPFAASLKRGAWSVLAPLYPRLTDLPVHRRGDGNEVRYLLPANYEMATARRPNFILFLRRQTCDRTTLEQIDALEALCGLLQGAHSQSGQIDAGSIRSLTERLNRAHCARITYDSLEPALAAIDGLVCA